MCAKHIAPFNTKTFPALKTEIIDSRTLQPLQINVNFYTLFKITKYYKANYLTQQM